MDCREVDSKVSCGDSVEKRRGAKSESVCRRDR